MQIINSQPSAPSQSDIGFYRGIVPEIKSNQQMRGFIKDRGPCARVELILSARDLADKDTFSKSDPICVVEELMAKGPPKNVQKVYTEIGRTEMVKNSLNPKWNKKISLDYFFESKQHLRFTMYDIDSDSSQLDQHDFLGRCECELAEIVAAQNGTLYLKVKDLPNQRGVLCVCAQELEQGQRELIFFICRAMSLRQSNPFLRACFVKPNTFLEFHRILDDGSRQMVHRTEVVLNSKNPEWKPFEILVKYLCENEKDRDFSIECYDRREQSGNHKLIGAAICTVNSLVGGDQQSRRIELLKRNKNARRDQPQQQSKKPMGILHLIEVQLRQEFTFLDYITSGLQLKFAVSVDLTASNGDVSKPSSLHYVNSQYLNQYECAICSVLEICEHYNKSKQFEALGFGAKLPPNYSVSHMFPLRLNNSERSVQGIQGVLDAYRYAIVNTQLYGPTNFAPTIQEFVQKAKQFPRDGSEYQVLLILTDGIITDMQKTMNTIIDASRQPISIIIVGIGDEDFTKMDELDSDDKLLTCNGKTAARDIVQFVPFRDFTTSAWGNTAEEQDHIKAALAREVLAELPEQVCSFMKTNNIRPFAGNCDQSSQLTTTTANVAGANTTSSSTPYPVL